MKCKKLGSHTISYQSLLLSTIVLNDTTFIVSIIVSPRLVQIVFTGSLYEHYKGLRSMNNIFTRTSFFLVCLFLSFLSHTFLWACRSLHEPQKFFSFCAFTCLSNNSLIS